MPRKQKKYHYIYKITSIVNYKYYIGMHSTDNLEDGYMGSGRRIRNAVRKYGRDKFKLKILEFLNDRPALIKREAEIVTSDILKDPLCMNLMRGGVGGNSCKWTKAMRKKVSDRVTGAGNPRFGQAKTAHELELISKHHANVSGMNNPMYKKTHTKKARARIAEARKLMAEPRYEQRRQFIPVILNSGIDFTKAGWINKVASILNTSRNIAVEFIQKNMPDLYNKYYNKNKPYARHNKLIPVILNSDIDFTKIGWLKKVAAILNISSQATKIWIIKTMPEFYDSCYRSNSRK